MNCKPGDLAYIVAGGQYHGHFVTVLYGVTGDHTLPDGQEGGLFGCSFAWVCEKASGHFVAPTRSRAGNVGKLRKTKFAAIQDRHLRPIRDQDGEDETLTWAGKPSEVTA